MGHAFKWNGRGEGSFDSAEAGKSWVEPWWLVRARVGSSCPLEPARSVSYTVEVASLMVLVKSSGSADSFQARVPLLRWSVSRL